MADNANENNDISVEEVLQKNSQLSQMAQNQADVIVELRQMNSDKDLRIAELSATIKRFQNQVQAAVNAQANEVDDHDTEFEEVDENSADEQE
mgnify:FL=1